jgi:hypothetical protein
MSPGAYCDELLKHCQAIADKVNAAAQAKG